MFESLSEKLEGIFKKLKGRGVLNEESVNAALREIRMALLEADVNFKVVKDFIEEVRLRAVGKEVLESLTPGQQVVKIVHDRLVELMGGTSANIKFGSRIPAPIMLVGLQGCGKTTTAAKLARLLSAEKRVYLVSADVYRPAAMEQLAVLGRQIKAGVFEAGALRDPVKICTEALEQARREGYEVVLIDTAGRLHIDELLMQELRRIKESVNPAEILYVADAMTGQDAVNVGAKFNERIGIDGVIMTKMDGDARGGAALSLRAVVGKPLKFVGVGEKIDALEVFHPERMANRILGMGDILSLVEKAQAAIDEKTARQMQESLRKSDFTLEDFRNQLKQIKKMGPLKDMIGMIPGMGKIKALKGMEPDDGELVKIAAIIDSMTKKERNNYLIIDGRRRKRIARGSGTTVQDVNRLLKNYIEIRKMMKKINSRGGVKALMRNFPF
ncbi:MAG TPA: signal recognition particle protein [Smithellaceae bacterium]|jgi:signal recognition particle subunit SRP54|nr:signal recognition particle protein [Syntrophaceae bacterium]HOE23508.1 signal recognition particle protein [Smithellaceae bacterium]MBP9532332.1 signal recognition particle protein [Syntrophaceae bacterium]MBP9650998.1 signal recognition particle protein [Syntrophaceae bacterium]HOR62755.1 signal recognition particle protein [Smithellaceae bacterium]